MKDTTRGKIMLITSMALFGTIGVFRKFIPLSSSLLAGLRGLLGGLFLLLLLLVRRKKPDFPAIRKNLVPLLISGVALGINWVLLFEAYNYTTVATATLCYYLAPILIILVAPMLLKERLTVRKVLCVVAALCGMVFVSGVLTSGFTGLTGILFGIAAAVLYAAIVLLNKKLKDVDSLDRTIVQLLVSAPVTLAYAIYSDGGISFAACDATAIVLLAIVCIVHTGICYALYFGSANYLKAQTLAVFSYIDPVVAVLLSALFLHEPMNAYSIIGAVLILGAALISELPERKKER